MRIADYLIDRLCLLCALVTVAAALLGAATKRGNAFDELVLFALAAVCVCSFFGARYIRRQRALYADSTAQH